MYWNACQCRIVISLHNPILILICCPYKWNSLTSTFSRIPFPDLPFPRFTLYQIYPLPDLFTQRFQFIYGTFPLSCIIMWLALMWNNEQLHHKYFEDHWSHVYAELIAKKQIHKEVQVSLRATAVNEMERLKSIPNQQICKNGSCTLFSGDRYHNVTSL